MALHKIRQHTKHSYIIFLSIYSLVYLRFVLRLLGDFLAGDFLFGDFLAGDFLFGDFLAGYFLAGDLDFFLGDADLLFLVLDLEGGDLDLLLPAVAFFLPFDSFLGDLLLDFDLDDLS